MAFNKISTDQINDLNTPNNLITLNNEGKINLDKIGNEININGFLKGNGEWEEINNESNNTKIFFLCQL